MRPQGYTYDRVDRPREAHRALREEHNAVKAFLIEWAASWVRGPKHVVDLACGKGGDVNKWAPHATTYVGVDVSEPALQEARRRADERPRTRHFRFEHSDAAEFRLPSCNVVSMQLALHYLCDREERVRALLRNVGGALRPGGVFIVTTVDERAVPGPGGFGQQYLFALPPCIDPTPEYKVPLQAVRDLAREAGLELCFVRNFDRFLQGAGARSEVEASKCYVALSFVKG